MRKTSRTSEINLAKLTFLFFVFWPTYKANSQSVHYDSIEKQKYVLVEIHKTYEKVLSKGYESIEILEYLGNYYFKCEDYRKSKFYFDRLFKKYKVSQISSMSKEQYQKLVNL